MKESEEPQILWHYTSIEAAMNIIKTGTLHASMIGEMNDAEEGRFPKNYLGESIRKYLSVDEEGNDKAIRLVHNGENSYSLQSVFLHEKFNSPDEIRALTAIKRVCGSTRPFRALHQKESKLHAFACCFSEDRDSLNQWYGYGKGNGVALGFNITCLKETFEKHGFKLSKVDYCNRYDRELGKEIWERMLVSTESAEEILEKYLETEGAFVKSNIFASEREWRAVRAVNSSCPSDGYSEIDFRVKNNRLIPYVETKLFDSGTTSGIPKIPSLTCVLLGPQNIGQEGWKIFLSQQGYVVGGIIPPSPMSKPENYIRLDNSAVPLQS
ncbi:DUF2971 domain-containing protein [Arcanobacterium bovis]|uniref:DUF2971 domain-containing protein n=1 Tax=Arcanobacterium bovis TaxID=2529275 RepID=A0A4Q9UYU5_9ACTO|nr:DUF2971 domain-containing protein [Arcanobacterium bovis]TBW20767.1 DUF2971 domain-containing protein [Arcanobacterium bovis]